MYETSPSWSIKSKYPAHKLADTPSPSAYYPNKWVAKNSSSWIIGKEKRNKQNRKFGPSPVSYNANYSTKSSKLGKFGLQRYRKQQNNNNPGVGEYSPSYTYSRPQSPSMSFTQSKNRQIQADLPGPGAYQANPVNSAKSKGGLIGHEDRFQTQTNQNPSPSKYDPISKKFKETSSSFTKENKVKKIHTFFTSNPNPGPGEYSPLNSSFQEEKGFSLASKPKIRKQDETPGPGNYQPHMNLPESPKISIASKFPERAQTKTPGPGEYTSQYPENKKKGGSIGKQKRVFHDPYESNPGPGAYDGRIFRKSSPQYSLASSRANQTFQNSPGPGCYHPNKNFVKGRPQSAKIGSCKRNRPDGDKTPGPGQYDQILTSGVSKISFARASRQNSAKSFTPGPADYEIKTIFGTKQPYFLK